MNGFVRRSPARLLGAAAMVVVAATWAAPAQAAAPAHVTVHASTATALIGSKVTLSGVATPAHGQVTLQRLADGRWSTVSRATVAASGSYTLSLPVSRQPKTWTVRVTHGVARSSTLAVHLVAHTFSVRSTAPATAHVGQRVTVSGSVSPAATGSVRLQQLRSAAWTTVATARLTATSTYVFHLTPGAGIVQLRVVAPASTTRAAGTSRAFAIAVQAAAPTLTQPAPTQPAPTQPAPTQPAPTQPVTPQGPPLPAPPVQAPVITTEQRSTYGTPGNTDVLAGVGLTPVLQQAWADAAVGTPTGVVLGDGNVYVSGDALGHAYVTALRASDGSVLWGPEVLAPFDGSQGKLAYDNGRVFVVSTGCAVAAFDGATGTVAWSLANVVGPWVCSIPPVASGGRLFLQGFGLQVLDEATGRTLWGVNTEDAWGAPAVVGNRVVVESNDWMPGVLDSATGRVLWSKEFTTVRTGQTDEVAGGKIYAWPAVSHTGTVYDLATGAVTGTYSTDEQPAVDPANDIMVTVNSEDPLVYGCACTVRGRSLSSGDTLWRFRPGDGGVAPPLVVDGVVYLAERSVIYALNERTGVLLGSTDVRLQIAVGSHDNETEPSIVAGDGLLLVPVADGLVALRSSSTAEAAPVQEQEGTASGDCPGERDVVYVSRTCTWGYPQLATGPDTLQVQWDVDRRATLTASVQDTTGHVYATQTSSAGVLLLATPAVPAGRAVQVVVTDSGPDGGADYLTDFAGAEPHAALPPTATPSTAALGFGYVPSGVTATESFTVRNTGGSDLHLGKVTLDDPSNVTYSGVWDTCTGTVLPAGWSCTLRVAAHPQSAATVTGSVVITTAAGQQTDVTLSAAGR